MGRVRASEGRPGSIESQTLARGWALRPESGLTMEVVKDRRGDAKRLGKMAREPRDGRVGTKEAGQLVKAMRLTKASMGSRE